MSSQTSRLGARVRLALISISAGVLVAVGASAAQGAPSAPPPSFPSGYTMYAIDCDGTNTQTPRPFQLWQLDPSTGDAVPVGEPGPNIPTSVFSCAGQGTYQVTTGTNYFFETNDYRLFTADIESGAINAAVPEHAGLNTACAMTSDSAGTLYGLDWYSVGAGGWRLITINPSTMATTVVNPSSYKPDFRSCALTYNPVDGMIYVFNEVGTTLEIWKVDPLVGTWVNTGVVVDESGLGYDSYPDSMAIDENGIAWIQDDGAPGSGITAVDLATGDAWPKTQGYFDTTHTIYPNAPYDFYLRSIWIVPNPDPAPPVTPTGGGTGAGGTSAVLANTGSSRNGLTWVAVLGVVTLGSALMLVRRERV